MIFGLNNVLTEKEKVILSQRIFSNEDEPVTDDQSLKLSRVAQKINAGFPYLNFFIKRYFK